MEHDHSASDIEKEAVTVARPQGDVTRVEAPVTLKAYMMCVFAAFGGIFFGYDSGYISGVMGMKYFIETINGPGATFLPSKEKSLITSILSAGTFFGALMGGDLADWVGRRPTIIFGCLVFIVGVVLQTASQSLGLIVAGRLVAGFGVGFVSAIIILYMSEIAPRKVRGAMVSGYQFCICLGLLLASCVDYGTQNRTDSGSYRIPIGLQMAWALILATGIFFLPESPRFFVKKGKLDKAAGVLSRLRDQPLDSDYVRDELAEIVANHEFEMTVVPYGNYFQQWANCFRGSIWQGGSYLRRTILGTSMQMMQQWTGINFIFYFGTTFFQQLGTIDNPFLMSLVTTLVNVCSTPISFYTMEKLGRRTLLIWGALGMLICEFIVAIVGTCRPDDTMAIKAMLAFICIYIFFFATTWGPASWVVIGEVFPLPIRAKGVALSTASNWLWNCIIAVITPYMVDEDKGNLGPKVFYIWGGLCTCCFIYAYLLVPETKGLTLEQVDQMLSESTPRTSTKWKPHTTYAAEMGMTEKTVAGHAENRSDSE
ncbi:general substrate transporter [Neurospora crassa]|uniref:Monosaccharide transporter n=2 Tax=Neurospora TaxID=5140 RepID=Q7RWH1_NEUCR|nr:monosaccharide transporter [Neurospora crassa OR74A]EAA26741.1 monosaccharide transporter [Neurospora crassa OR74A]KHE82503.1 general substrate transporter [Neurospora crassa]|eukprot:XP_955977.1 monosaccharide transporter [Neurospora crassa OR74A]